jgi:hypothetical protein
VHLDGELRQVEQAIEQVRPAQQRTTDLISVDEPPLPLRLRNHRGDLRKRMSRRIP